MPAVSDRRMGSQDSNYDQHRPSSIRPQCGARPGFLVAFSPPPRYRYQVICNKTPGSTNGQGLPARTPDEHQPPFYYMYMRTTTWPRTLPMQALSPSCARSSGSVSTREPPSAVLHLYRPWKQCSRRVTTGTFTTTTSMTIRDVALARQSSRWSNAGLQVY